MTFRPQSVTELVGVVRDAHDRSRALRLTGRGTWLQAGGEVRDGVERVDLSGITGIVEYVPGDLTLTARAGTTLEELDAVTAPHLQWCPLLPWGEDRGTVGATFATATRGPCSTTLGEPRDLALGVEFVDGTGARVRAGGRVVKNVAGFDLTRLLVGSWGSIGAITELSVRLRACPAVDETWVLAVDAGDTNAEARIDAFRRGPLAPLALESLGAVLAHALGLADARLLVRLGGNASFVAASRTAVRALGLAEPGDPTVWKRYRALDPKPRTLGGNALSDPLALRVKERFDPRRILNPGILGETLP